MAGTWLRGWSWGEGARRGQRQGSIIGQRGPRNLVSGCLRGHAHLSDVIMFGNGYQACGSASGVCVRRRDSWAGQATSLEHLGSWSSCWPSPPVSSGPTCGCSGAAPPSSPTPTCAAESMWSVWCGGAARVWGLSVLGTEQAGEGLGARGTAHVLSCGADQGSRLLSVTDFSRGWGLRVPDPTHCELLLIMK